MAAAVTQSEIARTLGVSRSTVSRVLNGKLSKSFSATPELQAAIRSAARRMAYRPHAAARCVAEGRFSAVSLLFRADQSWLPPTLLAGISEALHARRLHLNMAMVQLGVLADDEVPRVLREQCVDGFLVHYAHGIPEPLIERIRQQGVPTVWLNTRSTIDCVYPDDFGAATWATREVLNVGHRRVAYLLFHSPPTGSRGPEGNEHFSIRDRRDGYIRAMRDAGMNPDVHALECANDRWGDSPTAEAFDYARRLLHGPRRPTAVVCQERFEAAALMAAALSLGLRLPDDLSVVCFSEMVADIGVAASTLAIPLAECGRAAVDMLVEKIESPQRPIPARAVPYSHRWFGGRIAPPPSQSSSIRI